MILGDDYLETMKKYIDISTIPQEMGGEAKDVIWVGPFGQETGISDEQVTAHVFNKYSTPQQSEMLNPDELAALKKACDICTEMGMCDTFHIIPAGTQTQTQTVESPPMSPRGIARAASKPSLPSNASEMLGPATSGSSLLNSDTGSAAGSRGDAAAAAKEGAQTAVSEVTPANPTITILNIVYSVVAVSIGVVLLWKECTLNSCSFVLLFYLCVYAALHLALV